METANLDLEIKKFYDRIKNANSDEIRVLIRKNLDFIKAIETEFDQSYNLKKKYGAFYTNAELSRFIIIRTLVLYLKKHISGLKIQNLEEVYDLPLSLQKKVCDKLLSIKICDPACGLGAFIIAALDVLISLINKLDSNIQETEIITTTLKNIFGFEINKSALNICIIKLYCWTMDKKVADFKQLFEIISKNFCRKNALFDLDGLKFDIVIGNPPYGNIMESWEKDALKKQDIYYSEIYCAFLLKALQWTEGFIGFLVPKSFLLRQSYLKFREQLISKANLLEIYDIGPNIFNRATNEVEILIYQNKNQNISTLQIYRYPNKRIITYSNQNFDTLRICLNKKCPQASVAQKIYAYTFSNSCPFCCSPTDPLNRIRIKYTEYIKSILEKLEAEGNLNLLNIHDFPKMIRGEEALGLKEVRKLIKFNQEGSCSFIYARDDFQYYYYINNKTFNLQNLSSKLLKGENFEYYTKPKLLIKHNNIFPQAIYTEDCICFTSSIYSLLDSENKNLKYLCGLINSSLIQFYCFYAINNQQNTTINLNQYMIRHLPLKYGEEEDTLRIVQYVDLLVKELKSNNGKITETIAEAWKNIDKIVFKLYNLSEGQKSIIINSVKEKIDFISRIYSIEMK